MKLLLPLLCLSACGSDFPAPPSAPGLPIATGVASPAVSPVPRPSPWPSGPVFWSPEPSPSPSAEPSPPAPTPQIGIRGLAGADRTERRMLRDGVAYANHVMADPCFAEAVMTSTFTEDRGMQPGEIWGLLSTHPVSVNLVLFMGSYQENRVWRTIGYEYTPDTVYMNRYFIQTASQVADNAIHEVEGHSQGFTHFGKKSTSVPYRLNQFFRRCAR